MNNDRRNNDRFEGRGYEGEGRGEGGGWSQGRDARNLEGMGRETWRQDASSMNQQQRERGYSQGQGSSLGSYEDRPYGRDQEQRATQGQYQSQYGRGNDRDFDNNDRYGQPNYGRQEQRSMSGNESYGMSGAQQYGRQDYNRQGFGRQGYETHPEVRGQHGQQSYGRDDRYMQSDRYGGRNEWQARATEQYGRDDTAAQRDNQGFGRNAQSFGAGYDAQDRQYGERDRDERGYVGRGASEAIQHAWDGRNQGRKAAESDMQRHGRYEPQRTMGERTSFRGRGPQGYSRSDSRVREDVCDALSDHHDIDASQIDVKVESGVVTLTGTVESRETRRLVEDVVEAVSGVKDLTNQLKVQKAGATMGTSNATNNNANTTTGSKDETEGGTVSNVANTVGGDMTKTAGENARTETANANRPASSTNIPKASDVGNGARQGSRHS